MGCGTAFAQTIPPSEYQWWALRVNAYTVHSGQVQFPGDVLPPLNRTGQAITLGVVDTGIASHGQFGERLLPGFDYWGGNGSNDLNGHGTHVSGVAAAALDGQGMVGIAPQAWLLPIRVLDASGGGTSTGITQGINWAIASHVKPVAGTPTHKTVFNMSLGGGSPFGLASLQQIKASGSVAVVAAGNEGARLPSYPARYATDATVAGWVLAVGAVDANNNITPWSNRAGSTANYYLVAPGSGLVSTYLSNAYASMSGTSMAAPVVSGAAAVVWGAWPYLKGDQVVKSLLWSATDLGVKGVDSVYGWGLLDLAAALQPLGATCVPTGVNSCSATSTTGGGGSGGGKTGVKKLNLPAASGYAIAQTDTRLIAYDGLGRHFHVSPRALLNTGGVNQAEGIGAALQAVAPVMQVARPGLSLQVQGDGSGTSSRHVSLSLGDKDYSVFAGSGLLPFGASHTRHLAHAFVGSDALKIPYVGFMQLPMGAAVGTRLGPSTHARFGLIHDAAPSLASRSAAGFAPLSIGQQAALPGFGETASSHSAIGELSQRFKGLEIVASVGALSEKGAFLGAVNAELPTSGTTVFTSLALSHELGEGFHALSSWTRGVSRGATSNGDIALRATTETMSMGLLKNSVFSANDRLALSVGLPSRIRSGTALLTTAVDVDMQTGLPVMGQLPVSLAPQGRERRYELTWSNPVRQGNLAVSFIRRLQPDHQREASAETILGLRLSRVF